MRSISNSQNSSDQEQIVLFRAGTVVSSLAGAFGTGLRETRLTAMLGYLVAARPELFCDIFAFRGQPLSVSLEMRHAADRSDIIVETTAGRGVVEAKVSAIDPFRQSLKYRAQWRVLLTEYMPSDKQTDLRGTRYVRWRDLAGPLRELGQSKNYRVRFVSRDLLSYLGEHDMIRANEPKEIYARDLNTDDTLALFLQAQMYGCDYQKRTNLAGALYFAPCFGNQISRVHPGVRAGISYIARIERVEVVETWKSLLARVIEAKDRRWLRKHLALLRPLRSGWAWPQKRYLLFLSRPRMVFNPPVLKANLQKGRGFLGKTAFSFDDLFEAWGL